MSKKEKKEKELETEQTSKSEDTQKAGSAPEEKTEVPGDGKPVTEQEAAESTKAAAAQAQIDDLNDRLRRSLAEFDNYRKRTDAEKAARFDMGKRNVIEQILPVVDNFERGLATLSEEQKEDPFVDGMDKTYRHLMSALEGLGVKPIEAVGQPFNPDFHNAVMHVEDEEQPANTVVEEFQKGYTMNGTVVRYSMVKVAN
ncbi:MAG: nucleotide exchange factor GrpE [Lachnospiraceae bacterium]|nr:nucleotide exchange factor GrpE [Lachnospiraceae bacterium]